MQWAVDQQADVVSMSLGNPAIGDCTDPVAQAAQQLSQNTHTLFVVAAGNAGSGTETVSSPGCAPGVLTVGAVDRDDTTAWFSSRGPVAVTHTLKPEIAAPGVDISAANAGGRGVYAYQTMSGTSMATPHVAGAAAIVRQAHPDWTAQQIKAALVSSARTGGKVAGADQTGAGVLDVFAAVHQKVLSAPAVQAGSYNWPQDASDRTTVQVPFTNTSGRRPHPESQGQRCARQRRQRRRLPRHQAGAGQGDRPRGGHRPGAAADRPHRPPQGRPVRCRHRPDPGHRRQVCTSPCRSRSTSSRRRSPCGSRSSTATASPRPALPPWTWSASTPTRASAAATRVRPTRRTACGRATTPSSGFVATYDANNAAESIGYLAHPQLRITRDTTVVLDARKAHRLSVHTDRPSTVSHTTFSYARTWDDTWQLSGSLMAGSAVQKFYASVDGRARNGTFEFRPTWRATGSQGGSSYVYNLSFPTQGPLQSDQVYRPQGLQAGPGHREVERPRQGGRLHSTGCSSAPPGTTSTTITVSLFDPVHVPGTRTAYYTTGDDAWYARRDDQLPVRRVHGRPGPHLPGRTSGVPRSGTAVSCGRRRRATPTASWCWPPSGRATGSASRARSGSTPPATTGPAAGRSATSATWC